MQRRFNPSDFEKHWIEQWEKEHIYVAKDPQIVADKNYTLVMFPYPSGAGLHVGHARVYTGADVLARYYHMKGDAVLHPMGWDAFGLPAENAAIKEKKNPRELTEKNIAHFKRQMKMLGLSYDWSREINTTDPSYYAVTQWFFIEFFKHGLLYKKETPVYYCPFCKTGLAQEEVQADGTHERCGKQVERRHIPQWIFRITTYAEQLLEGLEGLEWPQGILEMQKNWIGRKEGLEIEYPVEGTEEKIKCFTTRPDTNFGATFIVIAPEHPFIEKIINKKVTYDEALYQSVKDYVETSLRKTERERQEDEKKKAGVFTGFYAINRLNGDRLPIWVSDFVLAHVGTGAVVGVPGHDLRDFDFARAFHIPIKRVVVGPDKDMSPINQRSQVQEEAGTMVHSDFLDGIDIHEATKKMINYCVEKKWGSRVVTYHLRDWIFSRQRYWGEPIPMVYCKRCAEKKISYWSSSLNSEKALRLNKAPRKSNFKKLVVESAALTHGWFPLTPGDLPLELPYVESYEPSETGASPLAQMKDWVGVACPNCGGQAQRETDTMPNWAGSCWYFLAFASRPDMGHIKTDGKPWNENEVSSWLPVDWYIGGAEHAVLHLLYARFWMHVLYDMGIIKFNEPFKRLRNVGMVIAEDNRKMSKSLGNVITPDPIVKEYGADTVRVYEMFMAPFNQEVTWSTKSLQGAYRFLKRFWHIYNNSDKVTNTENKDNTKVNTELQNLILKISRDIPNVKFNTPIAGMMAFLNMWEAKDVRLSTEQAKTFLKLLAPFAPFITEEIWRNIFREKTSIHLSSWPVYDAKSRTVGKLLLPIQINGKVRDTVELSPDADEMTAINAALESEKVQKWLADSPHKVVYVKGRILNFVTPHRS